MKVLFSVGVTIWLVACASSPYVTERREIEQAFLSYMGKSIKWSPEVQVWKYDSVPAETTGSKEMQKIPQGYEPSEYFVSHDYELSCFDTYSVFERCDRETCSYVFERLEGICE